MWDFDDSRLDDEAVLAQHDDQLRWLAGAGARIRMEAGQGDFPAYQSDLPPRGIIVIGEEAEFIRAVLDLHSQVPALTWSSAGIPAWTGPLDLVVILASTDLDAVSADRLVEAKRRGAMVIVATPADVPLKEHSATVVVPTRTGDPTAAAVVVLSILYHWGFGPQVDPEAAAAAVDSVAEDCSPFLALTENPAKEFALGLAEANPLIWGGSALAGQASRKIAEAFRRRSGRLALTAEADDLLALMEVSSHRDLFADPFDTDGGLRCPALVVVDDYGLDEYDQSKQQLLVAMAESRDLRVCELLADEIAQAGPVDRYLNLVQKGLYGAAYLGIGLGRSLLPFSPMA